MNERVFVYGTLRSGGMQESRMRRGRFVGRGSVNGQMYRVDWYPAVILGDQGNVIGEVYEVAEDTLAELDVYEGDEYRRVRVAVSGDAAGEAWIWEWNQSIDGFAQIVSGDWLAP